MEQTVERRFVDAVGKIGFMLRGIGVDMEAESQCHLSYAHTDMAKPDDTDRFAYEFWQGCVPIAKIWIL